jgi:hypothetical protein
MRAIGVAAVVGGLIAAAPVSGAADTLTLTYTFPSPLLDYTTEDGTSFVQFNPMFGTLKSVTLRATANATWSGGASADDNEADYTIFLSAFDFSMTAVKTGNGRVGTSFDQNFSAPADLSAFTGIGMVDTSVSVTNQGGSPASISSTFGTEVVSYNFTPSPAGVPGAPGFPPPGATFSVPQPSTSAMMLIGFAGLGCAGWLARRKSADVGLRA